MNDGSKEVEGKGMGIKFYINHYFPFQNLKGPPEINSRREKSVRFNSILQVNCLVKGFPKLEVNCTRYGKLPDTTNKLTIKQVTFKDAGQYTCSAENSEGKNEASYF